jgi:type I restriction enzyme R subunit
VKKGNGSINKQLTASAWTVQTKDKINLSAGRGVAICELSFSTGEPDYTPFVDGKAIGPGETGLQSDQSNEVPVV